MARRHRSSRCRWKSSCCPYRTPIALLLVVRDVVAVRRELLGRGVAVGDLFHDAGGIFHHADGQRPGPNPQRRSYASYATFSDPDGNEGVLQEITARLPGDVGTRNAIFTPEILKAVKAMESHPERRRLS